MVKDTKSSGEVIQDDIPRPPKDLGPVGVAFWKEICEQYDIECHGLKLLELASRALDSAERAREALKKGGLIYVDKHGVQRPRPEVLMQKNATLAFAQLMKQLGLDKLDAQTYKEQQPHVDKKSLNWTQRNADWRARSGSA